MKRLEKLFPNNPVWKGLIGGVGNVRHISVDEAKALYEALIEHYAVYGVSGAEYQTGNFSGSFAVVNDLQSTFDDLIEFFETKLGFTSSDTAKKAIEAKQLERKDREEQARAKYREAALALFQKLGTLNPPADAAIRAKLAGKLEEYHTRLDQWHFRHPDLSFLIEPCFRDTTFKIALTEAILIATREVSLLELAKLLLKKYGDLFNAEEFLVACGVISLYLGTPVLKGRLAHEAVTAWRIARCSAARSSAMDRELSRA